LVLLVELSVLLTEKVEEAEEATADIMFLNIKYAITIQSVEFFVSGMFLEVCQCT